MSNVHIDTIATRAWAALLDRNPLSAGEEPRRCDHGQIYQALFGIEEKYTVTCFLRAYGNQWRKRANHAHHAGKGAQTDDSWIKLLWIRFITEV